eukprot:TRINITY_DN1668_c0_g1_i4.p1 TRINITY_DN1668_c0_g1~~TRINITY_DN1668_c0_g1_i4.p1  ORF type:complete len:597 (+),score=195.43 TRINITY_DN1668_c0_g1_i4:134-1924(+)
MCLLKAIENDEPCAHEECKTISMLNRSNCIYNSGMHLAGMQAQSAPIQLQSFKRTRNNHLSDQLTTDLLDIISKKKKTDFQDVNDKSYELSMAAKTLQSHEKDSPDSNNAMNIANSSVFNSLNGMSSTNQMDMITSLLNKKNSQNQAHATAGASQRKVETPIVLNYPQSLASAQASNSLNSLFHPQLNAQNLKTQQQFLQNQMNIAAAAQILSGQNHQAQTLNKNRNSLNHLPPNFKILGNEQTTQAHDQSDSGSSSNGNNKDIQSKLVNLLLSQNKLLLDIKDKNDYLQDTVNCLLGEVNNFKMMLGSFAMVDKPAPIMPTNPLLNPLYGQILSTSTESATSESLLDFLYGSNCDFRYRLKLSSEFPLPLYRERNFKFTVQLEDLKGNKIENSNRIPLNIAIYSTENPPKYIDSNTSGNKILKGFVEKDLVHGSASFEKIQIKEVTSHFRNGWVFFVIFPKVSAFGNLVTSSTNSNVVDYTKIKPLIIDKVIVKAKKSKDSKDCFGCPQKDLDGKKESDSDQEVYLQDEMDDEEDSFGSDNRKSVDKVKAQVVVSRQLLREVIVLFNVFLTTLLAMTINSLSFSHIVIHLSLIHI